jgi:replicative DNA helicase
VETEWGEIRRGYERKRKGQPLPHLKAPPQIANVEAEMCLIGSALNQPSIAVEMIEAFTVDNFTTPAHQTLAKAVVAAVKANASTEYMLFTQFLRDRRELDAIGGVPYLTQLYTVTPSRPCVGEYIKELETKRRLRYAETRGAEIAKLARFNQDEPEMVFATAQTALLEIARMAGGKTRTVTMRENAMKAFERMEAIMLGQQTPGLPTGIAGLDRKLGGLANGEVIAITGDTGGGKTSLAHNIIDHVAVDLGKTVQLFSYELPAMTVTNRLMAARGSIDTENIRKATMTPKETTAYQLAYETMVKASIFIEDDANTTLVQLQARARKLKATNDTALIVVDYIQKVPGNGNADRRQREIAENSDGIQKLAMELDIPIIVLAQWNKKDGSVREAADIVFDAKTLLKIVRDDSKDIEDEGATAFRDIVIAKNNNGSIGKVPATFYKAFVRFEAK